MLHYRLVYAAITFVSLMLSTAAHAAEPQPTNAWSFDTGPRSKSIRPSAGSKAGVVHGVAEQTSGVTGKSISFDGGASIVEIADSSDLADHNSGFTVLAWVNVHGLDGSQQMIVGKNRYSLAERQWGVMIDRDNCFRLYFRQKGWATTSSKIKPIAGRWYQIAVTANTHEAKLFVNGKPAGSIPLKQSVPRTNAPLTIGGINDNGRIWQTLWGAIDEVEIFDTPLGAAAIARKYKPVSATHDVGGIRGDRYELWYSSKAVPKANDLLPLDGVTFHVIKPRVPEKDGYNWLHGVALAWHNGKLYSSFGHNTGSENTATEEANGSISQDGGKTWEPVFTIDTGKEPNLAISHGVFLSHNDQLWAFHGAFHGTMQDVHTRAYILDETTGAWEKKGIVAGDGFWAMHPPQKMEDGNWIMAGVAPSNGYGGTDDPAAVAISHGDDLLTWDVIKIPKPAGMQMWGEPCVFVDGANLVCVSRYRSPIALVSTSRDFGRTWTEIRESNLPMAASQPFTGTLSTGEQYLICTTTSDSGNRRSPLTIAVAEPDSVRFSRIYRIRDAVHDGPGESGPKVGLAYPYAVEHEGMLYVGYSNNGGRGGNRNSAELAIIPIESLRMK